MSLLIPRNVCDKYLGMSVLIPRDCNSLANSALKRSTGTFGIFARNAIMVIRLAVLN